MIVIATYNGSIKTQSRGDLIERDSLLKNLLESIESLEYKEDVLIIDTGSDHIESIEYLEYLKNKNPFSFNLIVDKSKYPYSTGAYKYAVENYKSEYYLFLQDSMVVKNKDLIKDIESKINNNNIVCWVKCNGCGFDNYEQQYFVYKSVGSIEYDKLIFGPVFSAKRKVVELIFNKIKILPSIKSEDSGMERAFGVICKMLQIDIISIDDDYDFEKMVNDKLKYITKYHINRI